MIDAIYARQSIDKKDSVSIEAQIEKCKVFSDTTQEIYFDKGWSGKSTDRPSMNKLVTDLKNGKINKVIVYRIDRISRNIVDFANLLNLFDQYKVRFVSATEQFDTSTAMGRAMIYIIMVFAQLERETIAARIKDNYKFRCATGKYFMGGNVPYGYTSEKTIIDGKKASVLLEDLQTSKVLQSIFKDFVSGDSALKIANKLNGTNITTNKGNKWSANAIIRIIKNITPVIADEQLYNYLSSTGYIITNSPEDFTGEYGTCIFMKTENKNKPSDISNQIVVVGTHQPLITSEQFIKANTILTNNSKQNNKKPSRVSFLAGLVKCGECDRSFGLKQTEKGGKKYGYYFCRSKYSRGSSFCNNHLWIEKNKFENDIIRMVKQHVIQKYSKTQKIVETAYDNEAEKQNIQNQINNLVLNIGQGNAVVDDVLTKRITELQQQLSTINNQKEISQQYSNQLQSLAEMMNDFDNLDIYNKTDIIRKIIDTIIITKEGKIKVKYLI